jgi:hypothetical protein
MNNDQELRLLGTAILLIRRMLTNIIRYRHACPRVIGKSIMIQELGNLMAENDDLDVDKKNHSLAH